MTRALAITLNALSLYAVALVLIAAFAAQLLLHELPCPLCLLQRIQFAMLAIGPIMNIRFGPRPSHYALSLLAAVAGAVASTRQVLLHIMPGDPGLRFGAARLSLLHLGPDRLHRRHRPAGGRAAVRPAVRGRRRRIAPDRRPFAQVAVWLVIGLTSLNVISALLECGFGACADNPVVYELLKRIS